MEETFEELTGTMPNVQGKKIPPPSGSLVECVRHVKEDKF